MAEKIKGTVKSMRRDKKSVLLTLEDGTDEWFDLARNVLPEYIIVGYKFEGSCLENELDPDQNRILNFIKCIGVKPQRGVKPGAPKSDEESEGMKRMSAIKGASRIYEGTGKEEDFKRLTDEIVKYIEEGLWTEKHYTLAV